MAVFKILSLDGGGIRGVAIAAYLSAIEKHLGHSVTQHFDLIAGASTGGIIAAGLAIGKSAEEIEQFYKDWGQRIFTPSYSAKVGKLLRGGYRILQWLVSEPSLSEIDAEWIFSPKYDATVLSTALRTTLGDTILNDAKHRLIIPAVDLIKGQTVVFRTPHLPNMVRDRHLPAYAVAHAAAAAPTYFQPTAISEGSLYVDGGLWANNPAMVAYSEAARIRKECVRAVDLRFEANEIKILSVGTGLLPYYVNPGQRPAGIAYWSPRLFEVIAASQSQAVDFQIGFLLPPSQYCRINFTLPDKSFTMDSVGSIATLAHRGRERANETFSVVRDQFLTQKAQLYVPFC
jgi:uncharacterized protein